MPHPQRQAAGVPGGGLGPHLIQRQPQARGQAAAAGDHVGGLDPVRQVDHGQVPGAVPVDLDREADRVRVLGHRGVDPGQLHAQQRPADQFRGQLAVRLALRHAVGDRLVRRAARPGRDGEHWQPPQRQARYERQPAGGLRRRRSRRAGPGWPAAAGSGRPGRSRRLRRCRSAHRGRPGPSRTAPAGGQQLIAGRHRRGRAAIGRQRVPPGRQGDDCRARTARTAAAAADPARRRSPARCRPPGPRHGGCPRRRRPRPAGRSARPATRPAARARTSGGGTGRSPPRSRPSRAPPRRRAGSRTPRTRSPGSSAILKGLRA